MSLCQLHWFSQVLAKQVAAYVLLPDVGRPPFATFYLLHGLSDDHTIWLRRTRVEWYVRDLPMIVVMPDGFRGFYTDNADGPAYGRYIGQELPAFIERNLPARSSRSARCIGGLSMGGYGALRTALAYPARFASATSHSGPLLLGQIAPGSRPSPMSSSEWLRIFGPSPAGTHHDLLHLARVARRGGRLPKLRLDCGTEDALIEDNRSMHRQFTSAGIAHEYAEYPGGHTWDYWDQHVREAVEFHAKNLKLRRGG
jgi:putative tributyrin esterase